MITTSWMKYESQNGCFKEKSTSNFLKNEHFLPPDTHTFSFFWKIWRALFSWNTRFEIRPSALLSVMFQLPLNLSFKLARIFRKKISISFSIFLQMHTFFYSFFSTNVLIIADENTHAFDGILFFSLILCFFQSSYYTSSIFFIKR